MWGNPKTVYDSADADERADCSGGLTSPGTMYQIVPSGTSRIEATGVCSRWLAGPGVGWGGTTN